MEEEKETGSRPMPIRRRSEGAIIASATWGAGILISIAVLLGSAAVAFSLMKMGTETKDAVRAGVAAPAAKNAPAAPSPNDVPPQKTTGSTTLAGAPLLGDQKKATVAIIEWSDLECPFCKKFHDDTFDQIVKEYVDTGKALFAFRDYPLDFHGEAAIKEANAARCVREAAGDKAYFSFLKDVYATTGTNGKGMPDEKLENLANAAARKSVASCVEDLRFKDAINADLKMGTEAGISGTPGFIIGKIGTGGTVEGPIISGAMPYSEFKKAIDAALGS